MLTEQRSRQHRLLRLLQASIEKQTYGRLTELELDCVENGVVVRVNSMRYHDVQLVIHAIQKFTAKFPHVVPIQLNFNVDGHAISLKDESAGTRSSLIQNQPQARVTADSQGLSVFPVPC